MLTQCDTGVMSQNSRVYNGPELVSCGITRTTAVSPARDAALICSVLESMELLVGSTALLHPGRVALLHARVRYPHLCWSICGATYLQGWRADGLDAGRSMKNCGYNRYYCDKCECDTGPIIYVDPLTGAVEYVADKGSFTSATWWEVDSSAILKSTTSRIYSSSSATSSSSVATTSFPSSLIVSSMPAPTSTSAPSAAASTQTLSPGASAGIGVGSTVAVVGVVALVWLFLRERGKRRSYEEQMSQSQIVPPYYGSGYPPPGMTRGPNKVEAMQAHTQLYEMGQSQEVEGTQRHELT
jgi:hypothetical protein